MPLVNFTIKPGVNKEVTDYTGQGQWVDSDNVRFFQGLPQKIGGWSTFVATYLVGIARAVHAWVSLDGTRFLAYGTDRKLYIYSEGVNYDITPIRETAVLSNPFTTATGNAIVTVADASHGALQGDFVIYSGASAVDGLDFNQEFEIQSIVNTAAYTIAFTDGTTASGTTAGGGGNPTANYQINVGPTLSEFGYGWGTGTWSASTWGTARTTSNTTIEARQWSLDNFGEDLIATVLNGGTFKWDLSAGVGTRAVAIPNAPTKSRSNLVSTPDRHLLLFGTQPTIGGVNAQDDLLIRFSNQEDIETYAATAENTAGSLRIADGSRIIGATRSRGAIMVWTDTSLHALQFIGPPFTFGLRQLGQNCGLIGQHAAIDINGNSYWMSQSSFYVFDGSVKKLPCTVEQAVFSNISITASQNAYVGHNDEFNEIIWFYASANATRIDRQVTYNYIENTWWTGSLDRTTWIDREVFQVPIGTEYLPSASGNVSVIQGLTSGASVIYQHETGNDADGSAMTAFITSGAVGITEGEDFAFVRRYIPDIQNQSGTLNMDLNFLDYPNDTTATTKSSSFTSSTDKVDLRGRGRQFTANIVSNTTGTAWRLGTIRFDIQPDGRR
tara:strand:+ start:12121 stop:13956 length:1836 start_codon:yes stop_codon:yes gene_type:complete